jgi:hypothetical protein
LQGWARRVRWREGKSRDQRMMMRMKRMRMMMMMMSGGWWLGF